LKIENKKQKNRKTQKIVISLCLLRPCLLRVLWWSVCFCTGHFVMVPINLTCPHCLQHFFFEHPLHLYYSSGAVQFPNSLIALVLFGQCLVLSGYAKDRHTIWHLDTTCLLRGHKSQIFLTVKLILVNVFKRIIHRQSSLY